MKWNGAGRQENNRYCAIKKELVKNQVDTGKLGTGIGSVFAGSLQELGKAFRVRKIREWENRKQGEKINLETKGKESRMEGMGDNAI